MILHLTVKLLKHLLIYNEPSEDLDTKIKNNQYLLSFSVTYCPTVLQNQDIY
jgi:hypothetical protein